MPHRRPFPRFQRQPLDRNPLHPAFARHILGPQQYQLQPSSLVVSRLSQHQVGKAAPEIKILA
jgi:hypothetical protein